MSQVINYLSLHSEMGIPFWAINIVLSFDLSHAENNTRKLK